MSRKKKRRQVLAVGGEELVMLPDCAGRVVGLTPGVAHQLGEEFQGLIAAGIRFYCLSCGALLPEPKHTDLRGRQLTL